MEITWQQGSAEEAEERPARIVIEVTPDDDPEDRIADLLRSGYLAAFLAAYARRDDLGAPESVEEARSLLIAFGYVTSECNARLEAMQLAARDQWRMGWGRIASAVQIARSTVKGRIQAAREDYAQLGIWYDAAGHHRGTPDMAHNAALAAWDRDGREPYLDADDPDYRTASSD